MTVILYTLLALYVIGALINVACLTTGSMPATQPKHIASALVFKVAMIVWIVVTLARSAP